ncbi:MAG: hypothetical protein CM1200mP12_16680 [Gammaproteobacteria bacterium]|nr:MAG: hypothetical protein CM1200mP12_16680 [Gammaproteobacteria bacterium]
MILITATQVFVNGGIWIGCGMGRRNTRDSIFNAFRRKETYATSGNRIKLRFFAGEDLDSSPLSDEGLINKAYSKASNGGRSNGA